MSAAAAPRNAPRARRSRATPPDGTPAPGVPALLAGWGLAAPSRATVRTPRTRHDLDGIVGAPAQGRPGGRAIPRPLIARGLGRSYGDAALCAGGTVVSTLALDRVLEADLGTGRIRVEAGISLDTLMRIFLPLGWFVPVTPGTRHVTVGGAVAADVHGKNHHRDGSFCSFVDELTLVTPHAERTLSPGGAPQAFWATAGSMGLTGAVADATIRMLPVETSWMVVDTQRIRDLDELLATMAASDARYRYSVAWIDCLAKGRRLGRSVLTRGDHAALADLPVARRSAARAFAPPSPLAVPFTPPVSPLNALSVAAFNELWYRRAPARRDGELQRLESFFHPLDGVAGWNRLYGARGFTQYQFVVPLGAEAVVERVLARLATARVASFLAVLKRFGPADPGPLSFPMEGWTLALDIALATRGLAELLDELDGWVAEAGGRVYLAKDGRLRPELLPVMYPRLGELAEARRELDPDGAFASDLARRLGLLNERRSP